MKYTSPCGSCVEGQGVASRGQRDGEQGTDSQGLRRWINRVGIRLDGMKERER